MIGFIGLGIMGKPMARNLLKSGYSLVVYDINKEAVKLLCEAGAQRGLSCADTASRCDVLITMLPNSPHVREAILGKRGILETAKSGCIIVDMSSISPVASKELSLACAEKGVVYLDCPVSGGEPKAIDATLSIMCGGPESAFQQVEEILHHMGTSVVLVGDVGSGNMTKLANQIIVAVNIAAMGEAMELSAKAGVDPKCVFDAIKGGLAGSTVLNAKMPMVLARNFTPGFRIALHIKDLMNVVEAAEKHDSPIPLTTSVLSMMNDLREDGKEALDHSAIVQYYEKAGGTVIASIERAE